MHALAFTRDGKTLATGCDDQTARLWNTASGLPRGEPMQHRGPVVSVAFSPDDSTLVRQAVTAWCGSGTRRPAYRAGNRSSTASRCKSALIAPDGKSIASIDRDGRRRRLGYADRKATIRTQSDAARDVEVLSLSAPTRRSSLAAAGTVSSSC